jgi:hypothetical protein
MGGDLRALLGAGRLQRTLAMRMLRVASASVLSLVALLVWRAAEPSAARAYDVAEASAVPSAVSPGAGSTVAAALPPANRKSAQSARVAVRPQLLARSRATEGDGEATPTCALASSPAGILGDVGASARACLRRLALGHAPYGEPSPFDATAPPTSGPRNG